MTVTKRKTRQPLRDKPLREPGQSLREEVDRLILDEAAPTFIVAVFACLYAGYEWIRWFARIDPHPIGCTIVAGAVVVWAATKIRSVREALGRVRKGIDGELHSAQFMQNELTPLGYRVVHDVCEDGYNIDHALIGPTGVFAIETKAFSKPEAGEAKISYDGEQLLVNGFAPDRNPIAQAEAAAARLRKILFQHSGMDLEVQPVVLVPGWKVDRTRRGGKTWVVNFLGLGRFLEHEADRLKPDDVRRLFEALAHYQRSSGRAE
jgi:hypothetical protein